ncbi:MAG: hypothetical protein ACRDYE_13270, partial [Acidimicrobiales bacterium]
MDKLRIAILMAIATILVAACSSSTTTGSSKRSGRPLTAAAAVGTTHPYWLINDGALKHLVGAGLSPQKVKAIFDTPKTLLIVKDGRVDPLVPAASLVQTFDD